MDRNEAAEMLDSLGKQRFAELMKSIPADGAGRFALFLEITRIVDYWSVHQQLASPEKRLSVHDESLARWGWSLAAKHLLRPLELGGIPVARSDNDSLTHAGEIVRHFGIVFLLHRCAAMIRAGFMVARREQDLLVVDGAEYAATHFRDDYELNRWLDLEEQLEAGNHPQSRLWQPFESSRWAEIKNRPGNWMNWHSENDGRLALSDPLSVMSPLVRPWSPGKGPVMMSYSSSEEIDNHFIAETADTVRKWCTEIGVGGRVPFGKIDGGILAALTNLLASFCVKHVAFAQAAAKDHKSISIPHCLTIWTPIHKFQEDLTNFTGLDRATITEGLAAFTLRASEAENLSETATFNHPFLIDLGNGLCLRPVAAVTRNPLAVAATMLAWRDRPAWDRVIATREERMREEFYALFQGARYARVEGNVKIREGTRILTDIDAAILDRTSGELLLVQLKWQDIRENDFRSYRSKAKNLSEELNRWAGDVLGWLQRTAPADVARALRFRQKEGEIRKIYLLGLSQIMARPDGLGYGGFPEQLAVANWYHFLRTRFEIGPVENVFGEIHTRLKTDHATIPEFAPRPFSCTVGTQRIRIERMWCAYR